MMLVMSVVFKDRLARFLEYFAAIALVAYGSSASLGTSLAIGPVPAAVATTYPAFAIVAALAIGRLLRNRLHYALAAVTAACWGFGRGGSVYERVRRTLPGLRYLVAAIAALAVALLISLVKARRARRVDIAHRRPTDGEKGTEEGFDAQRWLLGDSD
jgi:ABC-type antimicrobial peptide transport system permease subunit